MLTKPVVAGVSQVTSWGATTTVADVMSGLGQNTGNMMFTEAICRVLSGARNVSFAIPATSLEGRDSIVLAAANWVNEFDDFGWLANVLENTNLPIFLIGVGAQASINMDIPRVKPGTLRLLKIVAERSNSIAARGEFTCEVLSYYGIKNVVATGCPSLLLAGHDGPQFRGKATSDGVVLHATRHGFQETNALQAYLYRQALKQDFEILLQSEHADVYLAKNKTNNPDILAKAHQSVRSVYATEDVDRVAKYLRARGLFFTDFERWISHMKRKTFCFGTRFHGTIASIVAGTRAVLVAHDSRTLEMAKIMNIPYVPSSALDLERDLEVDKFFPESENKKIVEGYRRYRDTYMSYFKSNGLSVV